MSRGGAGQKLESKRPLGGFRVSMTMVWIALALQGVLLALRLSLPWDGGNYFNIAAFLATAGLVGRLVYVRRRGSLLWDAEEAERGQESPQLTRVIPGDSSQRHSVTIRDVVVAVLSGAVVAIGTLYAQALIDDRREEEADRRENLRFLRELAADGKIGQVSFNGLDLEERNLRGLKLAGADLDRANLKGTDLSATDLSGASLELADLTDAWMIKTNLNEAFLSSTDLSSATVEADLSKTFMINVKVHGTDLSKAKMPLPNAKGHFELLINLCYDENTKWPEGFPSGLLRNYECSF